jgi:hypothetical protein
MWSSLRPTISRGVQVIILSTPKSEGSLFHTLCMQAQTDESYAFFSVPWNECPIYDNDWYDDNRKAYTQAQWEQEFECKWGTGDDILIRYEDIKNSIDAASYYYPEGSDAKKAQYVMGIDFAGDGNDKSVCIVLDVVKDPYLVVECHSIDRASAPVQQEMVSTMVEKYPCVPLGDKTGMGWGIVQNLNVPITGAVFTSGKSATRDLRTRDWHIPRDLLINNLILGIETKRLAIPFKYKDIIQSLYGARQNKKKSINADFLDALALAYWSATQLKQRKRVLGQKPVGM